MCEGRETKTSRLREEHVRKKLHQAAASPDFHFKAKSTEDYSFIDHSDNDGFEKFWSQKSEFITRNKGSPAAKQKVMGAYQRAIDYAQKNQIQNDVVDALQTKLQAMRDDFTQTSNPDKGFISFSKDHGPQAISEERPCYKDFKLKSQSKIDKAPSIKSVLETIGSDRIKKSPTLQSEYDTDDNVSRSSGSDIAMNYIDLLSAEHQELQAELVALERELAQMKLLGQATVTYGLEGKPIYTFG